MCLKFNCWFKIKIMLGSNKQIFEELAKDSSIKVYHLENYRNVTN